MPNFICHSRTSSQTKLTNGLQYVQGQFNLGLSTRNMRNCLIFYTLFGVSLGEQLHDVLQKCASVCARGCGVKSIMRVVYPVTRTSVLTTRTHTHNTHQTMLGVKTTLATMGVSNLSYVKSRSGLSRQFALSTIEHSCRHFGTVPKSRAGQTKQEDLTRRFNQPRELRCLSRRRSVWASNRSVPLVSSWAPHFNRNLWGEGAGH